MKSGMQSDMSDCHVSVYARIGGGSGVRIGTQRARIHLTRP